MYSIAATYFEPSKIIAFEIDDGALQVAKENLEFFELEQEQVELIKMDILSIEQEEGKAEDERSEAGKYLNYFDTIVMNPPFGTKNNEGIDMKLLKAASKCLKPGVGYLYSLHKASTMKYIEKYVKEELGDGYVCEMMSKIQFDLPNTYRFHKKKQAVTEVVLVRVGRN